MKKNKTFFLTALAIVMGSAVCVAQNNTSMQTVDNNGAVQPFLFSVSTLTAEQPVWNLHYSGSYGERVSGPFGYDGVDQQVAVKGYLGNRFTLYANAGFGFARDGSVTSAQQAEVMHDFVGGRKMFGPRLGLSLGVSHDMTDISAVYSRVTASFDAAMWRLGGNLRFEKAFSSTRDDIDLITSIGIHHRVVGGVFAGFEAVGEDLEGFWESNEAEGGAKLLVGPSLNFAPAQSRLAFSLCAGPVFYATHSTALIQSGAIRDVGTIASQNGYTIRAMATFNLH